MIERASDARMAKFDDALADLEKLRALGEQLRQAYLASPSTDDALRDALETRDVLFGMTKVQVMASLGQVPADQLAESTVGGTEIVVWLYCFGLEREALWGCPHDRTVARLYLRFLNDLLVGTTEVH
ncbi:MAG TPA: hypothetical protein VGV13_14325 [Methylomirabilota bacterium]|nr:hypothetical protein [Methylomirabilota bacterium]